MNCLLPSLILVVSFSSFAFGQGVDPASIPGTGAYLVHAAGCADCHSTSPALAFAGGLKMPTPFGVIYTANLTPDNDTGIGEWSFEDFRRALREGLSPHRSNYYPVFPYRSYTKILDSDMRKMWEYFRGLEPKHKPDLPSELPPRIGVDLWKSIYLMWPLAPFYGADEQIKVGYGEFKGDPSKSKSWNRGAYLSEAIMHCAECHTHRDFFGGLHYNNWMAGGELEGEMVPNITPDVLTGRGHWSKDDWMRFLASGRTPNKHVVGKQMAQVIQNTSKLTKDDQAAVAEYMMSLKPVHRGDVVPE